MNYSLGILDRIILLQLTAALEGDILLLRIIRDLRSELSFTEAENAAYEIAQVGTQITWNEAGKTATRDYVFGEKALAAIRAAMKRMSDAGAVKLEQLSTYEKFSPPETP